MNSRIQFRLKFRIRALLTLMLLCALATSLLYPFAPAVSFSEPVISHVTENDDGVRFKHYEIEISNDSVFPIWCDSNDGLTVTSYYCYPSDTLTPGSYQMTSDAKAEKIAVFWGQSKKILFHTPFEWNGVRIEVEAIDWRSRFKRYKSDNSKITDS